MSEKKKISIVGGNSQVATEVAIRLYPEWEVQPIVRNQMGTSFLETTGIECSIHDMASDENASSLLKGSDIILIAAFVPPLSHSNPNPKAAREKNTEIIKNVIKYSQDDTKIVYLSSIAAFGNKLYNGMIKNRFNLYPKEKRHCESVLKKYANGFEKEYYIFRLGHVFGDIQSKSEKIKRVSDKDSPTFCVEPERKSNVVHTVSICDAIERCHTEDLTKGTYTLTNFPQWSWKNVIDYYLEDTSVQYSTNSSSSKGINLKKLADKVKPIGIYLMPYLPDKINDDIVFRYRELLTRSEINKGLQVDDPVNIHEFQYLPAPGRPVKCIRSAQDLLKSDEYKYDLE